MPRFKLTIEYDGAPYSGWQRQPDRPSVQGAIEEAIRRFSGESVTIRGAGRTDAGVHARGQVAHADLAKIWQPSRIRDALNAHLRMMGERIAILACEAVDESFDARLSAIRRHYRYRVIDRRPPLTLDASSAWHVPRRLDAMAMAAAAAHLVGRHDFTTFRSAECQAKSPVRTLERCTVERQDDTVDLLVSARSFLHHQVRSMAGSLVEVGLGKWSPEELKRRLDAAERRLCGPQAPPQGLVFLQVDYPDPP